MALPIGTEEGFFFLRDLDDWQAGFFVFQVMFCGTAATIVSGAVAERMKLSAYVLGSLVLSGFIYPVFVHWSWGSALWPNDTAFLSSLGLCGFRRLDGLFMRPALDFARGLHGDRFKARQIWA